MKRLKKHKCVKADQQNKTVRTISVCIIFVACLSNPRCPRVRGSCKSFVRARCSALSPNPYSYIHPCRPICPRLIYHIFTLNCQVCIFTSFKRPLCRSFPSSFSITQLVKQLTCSVTGHFAPESSLEREISYLKGAFFGSWLKERGT